MRGQCQSPVDVEAVRQNALLLRIGNDERELQQIRSVLFRQ